MLSSPNGTVEMSPRNVRLIARQVHKYFSATFVPHWLSAIAIIFEWNVNGIGNFVLLILRRRNISASVAENFCAEYGGGRRNVEKAHPHLYTPHVICTLTNAKPIIIAAQTLKRCSINRKWLSPNFYFRLELRAIYHSERYEGGALGHAGRWYYSAITWGKMEDLRASKCIHVMAFLLVFPLNYKTILYF